jgi:carboxyl-terminal processing protease
MNGHNSDGRRTAGVFLLIVLAFTGGIYVERSGLLPHSRYGGDAPGAPFWEAWRLTQEHYVDRKAIQPVLMTRGAIHGFLASLGDIGHTTYLDPEEVQQLEKSLSGELEGIGIRLTIRKGKFTVVQTFPKSPAREAGMLPGDILVEVDGRNLQGLPMQKVVEMIRGAKGSTVPIRVLHPGKRDTVQLSVRREKIAVPIVSWHLLPGTSIAHIAILDFGMRADEELRDALRAALAQGAQGVIIDVRGNPGGIKDQAVAVTSEFLKDGTVFIEQDAQGQRTDIPVTSGGTATEVPMCVLIDEGTGSSAEIFAGAIQDHARGKLVGTRTFGTGTVLQPFPLSDGSAVLLAVREWLTPKGRQIWHVGITPDVEEILPPDAVLAVPEAESKWSAADLKKSDDRQLLKALEVLKGQMSK